MTPSLSMNWEQPYCPRFAVYEMAGPLRMLPPALRCLVQDFRDYAWGNFGLPSDLAELEALAKSFGISRYIFRKNWERVKNFFTLSGDRLIYPGDEKYRQQAQETRAKFQQYGRLGAEAKRQKQTPIEFPGKEVFHSPPAAPLEQTDSRYRDTDTTAAALSENLAAADEKPTSCPNTFRLIASLFADVTPAFIERLLGAARKVLPAAGDDDLALAVRATYRREKQQSPGLFLSSVPAWLQNQRAPQTPKAFPDPDEVYSDQNIFTALDFLADDPTDELSRMILSEVSPARIERIRAQRENSRLLRRAATH